MRRDDGSSAIVRLVFGTRTPPDWSSRGPAKATPSGSWKVVGGPGAVDYAWTLTHNQLSTAPPNANPYGLLSLPQGTFVADAGSNTLDFVGPNGSVQLLAGDPLPPPGGFPGDGVPTCVARAGGTTYVADLSGRVLKWSGTPKSNGNT